jgi:hypothetical protein
LGCFLESSCDVDVLDDGDKGEEEDGGANKSKSGVVVEHGWGAFLNCETLGHVAKCDTAGLLGSSSFITFMGMRFLAEVIHHSIAPSQPEHRP